LTCYLKINVPFDPIFSLLSGAKIWRTTSSEGKVVLMELRTMWKEMLIEEREI